MVLGAVAILLLVRRIGDTLAAPTPDVTRLTIAASTSAAQDVLLHLLVALTAVVVVGQITKDSVRPVGLLCRPMARATKPRSQAAFDLPRLVVAASPLACRLRRPGRTIVFVTFVPFVVENRGSCL